MEEYQLFYKYQSFDTKGHTFENLKNNQLFLSNLSTVNDPFDCKMNFFLRGRKEEWLKYFKRNKIDRKKAENILKDNLNRGWFEQQGFYISFDPTNEKYRTQQNNSFHGDFHLESLPLISCFTELNDNILMWSHYSDYHRGICICIKAKKVLNDYIVVLDSRLKGNFSKVNYQEDIPRPFNMLDFEERQIHINDGFIAKFSKWEYEKEWRLIVNTDEVKKNNIRREPNGKILGGLMNYDKHDLEGVVFGLKASFENAESVCNIIRKEYLDKGIGVNLYQAKEVRGKYALQIVPIDNIDDYLASLRQ